MDRGLGLRPTTKPLSLEGIAPAHRIQVMIDWFGENFEDPVHETPYNSREGGYLYIWGGPYDAREEIETAFPEASEAEIDAAVREIEADGIEWAPAGIRIQPEDDTDEPDIEEPPLTEQLNELASRLDAVETWLDVLEKPAAGFGHNQPPPEFQLLPDPEQLAQIRASIAEVRSELAKPDPANNADVEVVERARSRFSRFLAWVRNAAIAGLLTFATGYIEGAGEEAWQHPDKFDEHVSATAHTLTNWAEHLQLPF